MGEILYCGKRVDNDEWVEGYCVAQDYGCNDIEKLHYFIVYANGYRYEVFPDTIRQYTGLTDKNGKKIFEGDIIEVCTLDTGDIRRATCLYGEFEHEDEDERYLGWFFTVEGHSISVLNDGKELFELCEVIGNIHDSPELLKY